MRIPIISPSLICMEPQEMERQICVFLAHGLPFLHVDLIDGKFSPDIPLTLEQLAEIASAVSFPMDVHIMSVDSERYIQEVLRYAPRQVCFHWEAAIHADRLLRLIKRQGVRCGIALAPATPVSVLEYAAELCDFVLLMLINPGYASLAGEKMVSYAERKIADCRHFLDAHGWDIPIEVDGRVSLSRMPGLIACGADILVSGSTGVFAKDRSLEDNLKLADSAIQAGLRMRKEREACTANTAG